MCGCCLSKMWDEAGWKDEDWDGKPAGEMVPQLKTAVTKLKEEPERFRAMNPSNGWGNYDGLIDALEGMILCAEQNPKAIVSYWR
jgi:hypothetical protein